MSETEEDREYYQAAEAAFIRRRGTPFLLSPRDFAQVKEWRALGVPIEAIEQGIDDAFSRREERSARGKVNSLSYCRDAVLEAWERRSQTSVGRGTFGPGEQEKVAPAVLALADRLGALAARRPELAAPLESAARSLSKLAKSGRAADTMEASLARLDKRLARDLAEALPEDEKQRLNTEVETSMTRAGLRMDAETAKRTAGALTRRKLREQLDLPRLTLLQGP
jgi:hypothetical protein